jgi:predicted nucleotidyltransferase
MINTAQESSLEQISLLLTPFFQEKDLQLLILFGSTARGIQRQESDIDLAGLLHGEITGKRE